MRIIGIDPGLQHTGWGVIDIFGNRLVHVENGVIHTNAKKTLSERLVEIFDGLTMNIEALKVEYAAVEETFVNKKNPASALRLGAARGVALLAPARLNLPVAEYSANLVKKSVVGAGHADKNQVQMMVKTLLPGVIVANADAADALAIAICHAHHGMTSMKLNQYGARK